jgi:hypothetical protein
VIIPSLVQDQNKLSTQKRVTSKKKAAVAECLPSRIQNFVGLYFFFPLNSDRILPRFLNFKKLTV